MFKCLTIITFKCMSNHFITSGLSHKTRIRNLYFIVLE